MGVAPSQDWGRALLVALAVLGVSMANAAEPDCQRPCAGDRACEITVTECLIRAGRPREAVERLKALVKEHPDVPLYARLLARSYLAEDNEVWAERTLQEALAANPDDCTTRSWLAWLQVSVGDFDLARETLDAPGCPNTDAEKARWLLLRAFMAHNEDDAALATVTVTEVPSAGKLFPEDEHLWRFLRRKRQPGWIDPFMIRGELGAGYTSNASAGSPTDPATSGPSSGIGRLDLYGRLLWPTARRWQPTVDGDIKGHGISASEAGDLSYVGLSIRPGVLLGRDFPRLLVAYKADMLLLNEGEKRDFYEGHRGEMEFETGNMMAFLGGGRRFFVESGRTRWELDGGVGRPWNLSRRLGGLLAVSLRYHDAVGDAYTLVGGTGIAMARVGLGRGAYARLGTSVGVDSYFDSGGTRGQLAHGTDEKRFDVLTKLSADLWSPARSGFRVGLGYEFSWNESTADEDAENYEYDEHRVLLKVRWAFDFDPWAPQVFTPEHHVPLAYGIQADESGVEDERIQDLLRQDESARRGSSCVE